MPYLDMILNLEIDQIFYTKIPCWHLAFFPINFLPNFFEIKPRRHFNVVFGGISTEATKSTLRNVDFYFDEIENVFRRFTSATSDLSESMIWADVVRTQNHDRHFVSEKKNLKTWEKHFLKELEVVLLTRQN